MSRSSLSVDELTLSWCDRKSCIVMCTEFFERVVIHVGRRGDAKLDDAFQFRQVESEGDTRDGKDFGELISWCLRLS